MHSDDDLLTSREAAELLGCHPSTISRKVAADQLRPSRKLPGLRGPMLFRRSDVEALADPEPQGQAS